LSILVGEGDLAVVVGKKALLANGDAVGVTAEVAQDLLGAGEGGLGVDAEVLGGGPPPSSGLPAASVVRRRPPS